MRRDLFKKILVVLEHWELSFFMQFENTIIYLFGFPGTGKYTIAKEIVRQANFVLVDNHLINNPVFSVIRQDGVTKITPEVWSNCKKIWEIVWDTIHHIGSPAANYVLTNHLAEQDEGDREWFYRIVAHVEKKRAAFLPVRLLCSEEELRRRIVMPERRERMKITDTERLSQYYRDYSVLKPDRMDLFELDVTNIPASEAARIILKKAVTKIS